MSFVNENPTELHIIGRALTLLLVCALGGCAADGRGVSSSSTNSCHDLAPIGTSDSAVVPAFAGELGQPAPQVDRLMHEGADAYARGNFGQAAARFEEAARAYARSGRDGPRCDALIDQAAAYEALGSFKEAGDALVVALPLARRMNDRGRQIDALEALVGVYLFTRNYAQAGTAIDDGAALAAGAHDERAAARTLNNRGTLLAMQGRFDDAARVLADAAEAAHKAHDVLTEARALTNRGLDLLRAGQPAAAISAVHSATVATRPLPDRHDKASLLTTQGRTLWQARTVAGGDMPALVDAQAEKTLEEAGNTADAIGDRVALSFALGYRGEIAEADKRRNDAFSLTRRALFLAQEAQAPDALYRWQWQIARLLRDQGQLSDAIDAYASAIATLRNIHGDLLNGFGNQADAGSFRDSVGPIYYQMADLLLRRADAETDAGHVQADLRAARETVETLKSGELEDYFQLKCVNLLGEKRIEQVDAGTAVVYLISLPDRTEMLVGTTTGLVRFKSPIGSEELTREVREFRSRLEDRTSNRYLTNARKLYNWIIRPIEPVLAAEKIDTLVFVPDGALRTVPMAALNDGKEFLISKYAVAITPGLTLMSPHRVGEIVSPMVLEGGLSQSIGGFPALEFVPQELGGIRQLFSGTELLNQAFTSGNLQTAMGEHDFTYVHLASHAEFSHDEKETFLLVYPNSADPSARKLSLKQLGDLLRPTKFRAHPVELLALSACQTAAGDDRAALGLAGIALEMGARSAVATLWSINDQASADLVEHFYAALRADPTLSKAKAMRRAQVDLMHDARYRHPCYWAPYLVIGNWL